jgi:Carboxypeptidase regulatory-like domain
MRSILTVFLLCVSALNCRAQSTTSLRGVITDPSGAAIPGAIVTISSPETGSVRRSVTDASGEYNFLQVAPASYKLTVEKAGFATMTRADVKLLVNTPGALDMSMAVSTTGEVVNVEADVSQVNTTDASIGNPFSEMQVRQIPLQTRNVVELLSVQPGVTSNGEVLGARRDQNNVTLDGADVNNNQNSGLVAQTTATGTGGFQGSNANGANLNSGFNAVLPIPLDSVQEFRVTVAGDGPNQGRSSGGQVSLVTKSGTNQLHGSLYEYNRNTAAAANTWFNNQAGVPRQPLVRNQFGGSAGGKIVRDRVFYFLNYEQRQDASGVAEVRAVPSDTLRQGIFKYTMCNNPSGLNGICDPTKDAIFVQTLSASDLKSVDPLNQGVNASILPVLNQYPHGNAPSFGEDGGLNFSGYRFNAPSHRSDHAIVGKIDVHLDKAAKHTLSVRGTLADNTDDQILAQLPGQNPASTLRDNSKGFSAQYTAVLKANLINVLNVSYTRFGQALSGVTGPRLFQTSLDPLQNPYARPFAQTLPTLNPNDDVTWTKGPHTITMGFSARIIHNNTSSYANSFPRYGYGATELIGLGADIDNALTNFMASNPSRFGANPGLADTASVTNGMGAILGLVNDDFHTNQFDRSGNPLALGAPQVRSFIEHDYALYVGDSFRVNRSLTLTFGLRWEDYRPPYEAHGLQSTSTVSLNTYFAERDRLQSQGVPQNAMPNATLSWALNGPANGKPTWWKPSNLNFGPRFGVAYAPTGRDGWLGKVFGKTGAFRVGASMVYDRFGSDLITQYDQNGSLGVANKENFPDSYSFSTSQRYTGAAPTLPTPAQETFPYTPPQIAAIAGDFEGVSPNLKPPYAYVFNASFAREIPGGMTIEIGYAGRLSHRLLMEGDVYTPLEYFKDPKSGVTWEQNAAKVRAMFDSGLTVNQVKANPGLVPTLPFVEDMWPSLANVDVTGSASANYFLCVYQDYGGSYLDCLHALDRNVTSSYYPGKCLTATGCYTFFPQQGSSMPTWMNSGTAAYHGLTLSLRRRFAHGLAFDFNYAWSHSIDDGSAAESGAGEQGAAIQNIFNTREFRGSSDFDMRHNITGNVLYQLPFGKGRAFFHDTPGWFDAIAGGWQVSGLTRFRTGLPTTVAGGLEYNANYWLSSLAIVTGPIKSGVQIDQNGNPSIFANTSASNSFADELPGHTGKRAAVRLASFFNTDMAVTKEFKLRWESQRIQFRAEAFNVFNNVNFTNPSLALTAPSTFGEFQGVMDPRVMQFALRYEF